MKKDNSKPVATIWCFVYNHEKYLRQCLEGFVMQHTDFPFEAIVHDDVSTDSSVEIIREYAERYPDIIKPVYETENQYSKKDGSLDRVMLAHTNGRYVASCEGDDYWTDPLKLQKQVDFMESHPDYSMCAHNAIVYNQATNSIEAFSDIPQDCDLSVHDAISGWKIATASLLVRREYMPYPDWLARIYSGDYALILRALNGGKIRVMKDYMSVYRKDPAGHSVSSHLGDGFVYEQHNILLDSFNKATGGKYDKEISERMIYNNRYVRFARRRERGLLFCIFDPVFYKKLLQKIRNRQS